MAVRSSMQDLVARVRQLVGDVSAPQDLTDQDIQDACDANRADVRYELLNAAPDIQPPQPGPSGNAQFVWATYFSDFQHWESDVVLQGMVTNNGATSAPWVVLTPVSSDLISGKWTFAVTLPSIATPPSQFPPVYATGKAYDIYAAAASLLERRIAIRSFTTFDVTTGGTTLRLGSILDRWEKLAQSYWGRAWVGMMQLRRSDLAPDRGVNDAQGALLPGALSSTIRGEM